MPNPFRLLAYNAQIYPNKTALDDGSESLTYSQLYALVKRIATKLAKSGINPGDLVLTSLPPKLDWLFINALFHEACITCSQHGYQIPSKLNADWVISEKTSPDFPADKHIVIDQTWFDSLKDELIEGKCKEYSGEDALCRLILTSGTTGQAKAAAFSVKLLNERILRLRSGEAIPPQAAVSMMTLSTVLGFFIAYNAMLAGETCYFTINAGTTTALLKKRPITYLLGSPIQLSKLLDEIENNIEFTSSVKTIVAGGYSLSPALCKKLKSVFNAEIYCSYGSTEVGRVCINPIRTLKDLGTAGFVVYDATVEVVDESDSPLPYGQDGIVRVKTPSIIPEYYADPETTGAVLKNGWFYPGDLGRLTENGMLILAGRVTEVINRGGMKLDPTPIEQFIVAYQGVKDAAVFGLENELGIPQITAAIVSSNEFNLKALQVELLKKFAKSSPTHYFKIDNIPRTQSGKVARAKIKEQIAAVIKKRKQTNPA